MKYGCRMSDVVLVVGNGLVSIHRTRKYEYIVNGYYKRLKVD